MEKSSADWLYLRPLFLMLKDVLLRERNRKVYTMLNYLMVAHGRMWC